MTLSALASSVAGTVSPTAFAVFKLIHQLELARLFARRRE
jgi:hypothetical protein